MATHRCSTHFLWEALSAHIEQFLATATLGDVLFGRYSVPAEDFADRKLAAGTEVASMRPRAYLDHNATSPLRPEARAAIIAALDCVGNPSSIHAEGRAAREIVEDARETVAAIFEVKPSCGSFHSRGTEAANWLLQPRGGETLAVCGRGASLRFVWAPLRSRQSVPSFPSTQDGVLDLDYCLRPLLSPGSLATVQAANNETGVIQPIADIAESRMPKARGLFATRSRRLGACR